MAATTITVSWGWKCKDCGDSQSGFHDEEEAIWASGKHECVK